MMDKFTLEDLLIKIMPGGILICVLCFLYVPQILSSMPSNLDFLCTFIFITFSYLAGELIQTVAHLVERSMIYIFFKFYQPSEVFLYRDNPVIEDEKLREEILKYLTVNAKNRNEFNQTYKDLNIQILNVKVHFANYTQKYERIQKLKCLIEDI